MNNWFRRYGRWLAAALIVVLAGGVAYVLRAGGSAHAQAAAAAHSAALAPSAGAASASASPGSATRRRPQSRSAIKRSFPTLVPSSTPGRPGVRTPPPSAGALAQSLRRATGLLPSQVTTRAVCPVVGPRQARCAARALVLRSSGALVRPRPGAGRALGRVRSATAATTAAAVAAPDPATPAYLQQAYDLTALSEVGGSGDTVAIVDAYDDLTAESDLGVFRAAYGLPACTRANGCFRKVNQTGGTSSLPAANSDWEAEISLDLDAVSAICPNCHILLVEANSSNLTDLQAAMQTAASMGANQISDSWWGTSRLSRYTFSGVATVAATGDSGYAPSGAAYPAAYPGVTAAGGTSLASATSNVRGFGEQAWSGGGSGCNTVYSRPVYQPNVGCSGRVFADLSADADPDTGLKIYTPGGWAIYGGTSLAAPLIAAYYAITGVSATNPQWAYTDSGLLNDVVTGSNGTCSVAALCNGEVGYDGPTGVGSISGTVATGAPGVAGPTYTSGTQNTYTQSVGSQGATVGGGIYRNGLDTTWWIEYGTSQTYGAQTSPVDIGAGTAPVAVTGSLTGLTPATVYHYRLVAKNALGTTYGYDYTLTTAAASAPSAAFTVSPSAPTPSASVTFDASGSTAGTNSTISDYSWNFGDGNSQDTGTTPTASNPYTNRGSYTVTLTVTNNHGQKSTITQTLTVDNPPTAAVTPSATFTAPATSVTFDASGSSAGAGGTIKDYSWDFGDGTAKDSGPTASTTHAFASPGVYTVKLTTTDDLNVANSTTATITVDQPNASFTATPATAPPTGTFSFDATGSTDPYDTIADYSWNFGDSSSQNNTQDGPSPTASHQYATRGNYTVTLTITNNHGQKSTSTQTVTVDNAPTAAVAPSTTWTAPGAQVTFDASGSHADTGGTIKDYGWDFGDGSPVEHTGLTSAKHAFAAPGVYTVKLTVTDDLGLVNSATATITVDQPNASFTATPATVAPGGTVSFDATGSTDLHDTITGYRWDFGDGSQDTKTTASDSHQYANRGNYTVTLTVTNSHIQTGTATQTVTVDNPPIPTFTAAASTMTAGSPVTFNGSASTAGKITDYSWNFGDGTISDTGTSGSVSYTFASAGPHTVSLTTTDDLGVSATATRQFTVQAPIAATSTPPTSPAPTTPAPTPAPTPVPTTPAPSPSPSATLTGALTATQKQRLASVLAHGVRISVFSSASANVRFQVTVPRTAIKATAGRKSKGAPIVLLRTSGQTMPAGTHAFTLKLPPSVRRKLSTARRLVLTVQVTLSAGGHSIRRSLKITLTR